MKQLFLISLFALSAIFLKSQRNLQFNQVITEAIWSQSPSAQSCVISGFYAVEFTVPAGKVWKIESVKVVSLSVTLLPAGATSFCATCAGTANSGCTTLFDTNSVNNGNGGLPIWLKGGTTIAFTGNGGSTASFTAIEFNVN